MALRRARGASDSPVKYAYQVVGEVIEAGPDARFKLGQKIFVRHPHQDLFTVRSDSWLVAPVPEGLPAERAVFVNLLEVALNCHLDVPVRFGDVVAIYGQGVVGSLVAQLARRMAGRVIVVDPIAGRREAALKWGADAALAPEDAAAAIATLSEERGADICIEATGARQARCRRRSRPPDRRARWLCSRSSAPEKCRSSFRPSFITGALPADKYPLPSLQVPTYAIRRRLEQPLRRAVREGYFRCRP